MKCSRDISYGTLPETSKYGQSNFIVIPNIWNADNIVKKFFTEGGVTKLCSGKNATNVILNNNFSVAATIAITNLLNSLLNNK